MFSEKQEEYICESDAFINVAHGAVRSGKTFASLWRFAEFAFHHSSRSGDLIVLGKTERTIKRNVISPMKEIFGASRVRYVQGTGELYLKDRIVHVVGANDERAEEKIRGFSAAGAYCNELTVIPESAFKQLIDRCSVAGAKIFADTNPDSPFHWLKREYLDRAGEEGDVKGFSFELDDNPVLDEAYKERLHRIHTGVQYKRMVKGLWVAAEGAIFADSFDPEGAQVVDVVPPEPEPLKPYQKTGWLKLDGLWQPERSGRKRVWGELAEDGTIKVRDW